MLNRVSIEAALPVQAKLQERNARLLPKDGTPMMNLMLGVNRNFAGTPLAEDCDMVELVSRASNDTAHNLVMKDLVELASASVGRVLDNARNLVVPHINTLLEQINAAVDGRRLSATSPYQVVMKEIPAVYSNQALLNLAQRYRQDGLTYPAALTLNVMTLDDVINKAKTGMAGFDEELANLLSLNNNEGYATILDILAGRKGFGDTDFDYAAGLLVVAQAIYDEPGEGGNLGLGAYNTAINTLLGAASAMVLSKVESYRRSRELGTLYVPTQTSITQIVVMGEAYRKLLDQGLTPEALIGNEMAGRRFSAGQLIENKVGLEKIYTREMNLRALRTQTEMTSIYRNSIETVLRMEINTLDQEDVDKGILRQRVNDQVALLSEYRLADLNQAVIDVVCEVFYPETDARKVICIINAVGKQFGVEADPREVALLATIKYVIGWIAGQLVLAQA